MKKISILVLILLLLTSFNKPNEDCIVLDIILMADYSGSVSGKIGFVADALDAFVDRYKLADDGIRIGILIFSEYPIFLTGLSSNKILIKKSIETIRGLGDGTTTNMIGAFEAAGLEFSINGRPHVKRVIVLISDGLPDTINVALEFIPQINIMYNIYVCGVYVDTYKNMFGTAYIDYNETGKNLIKEISNQCYVASDYESLPNKLRKFDICI